MRQRQGIIVRLIPAVALAALLAGCASGPADMLASLNPFAPSDTPVETGDRKPILTVSDPAAGVVNGRARIGVPVPAADWPQVGGNAANDSGNVAGPLAGKAVWSMRAGSSLGGQEYFGMSSSKGQRIWARPVASGGVVYIMDATGTVSGYHIANSGGVWHVGVLPSGQSKPVTGGGVAVGGGRVYASTGYGEVLAIDASSSSILWRSQLDAPARSAPAFGGGKVVVMSEAGTVSAFDAVTGTKAWTANSDTAGAALLGSMSPAISADTVVVPGGSGQVFAFDLATGAQKWQASIVGGANIKAVSGLRDASASPVIDGDTVYATGVGGSLVALSLKTGETVWQQSIGSAEAPVVTGDSVFIVDLEGRAIAIDRTDGKVIWATALPPMPGTKARSNWVGPVMAGGRLWAVSSEGRIASIDATTGALDGETNIGFAGGISPILASGRMVILGSDGMLVSVN